MSRKRYAMKQIIGLLRKVEEWGQVLNYQFSSRFLMTLLTVV